MSRLLEFVCKDDDGDWYYLPDEEIYQRLKNKKLRGHIAGRYIPNPYVLFEKRQLLYPKAPEKQIKPTAATYALWEHWNAKEQKPS